MSAAFCAPCAAPRARVSRCRCCARSVCAGCLFASRAQFTGAALVYTAERGCCRACALDCLADACLLAGWTSPAVSSSSSSSWTPLLKQ